MSRPTFHYAPAANWLSDPNGLVYANGRWHLYYQHNPSGDLWANMAWGHASSADLVDWTEHPLAIDHDPRHLIFSGSAVVDEANTAGFGASALVAIYTGADRDPAGLQVQCLAASIDGGMTFSKHPGNPVLDIGRSDFRDPNVFWHAATQRWIMVVAVALESRALLYASPDLKHWQELSSIGNVPHPGRVWECPLLIELPVDGEARTRWLFKVDVYENGPGSGAIGLVGDFDGERFTPDLNADGSIAWQVLDHGRDFYAAIAWHGPRDVQGRSAWIGWVGNHGYQRDLPPRGWRGAMSLPRRLSLRRDESGYRVIQTVEPAVAARFVERESRSGPIALPGGARIELASPALLTFSNDADAVLSLRFDGDSVTIDRASGVSALFDAPIVAPMPSRDGVTLWLDRFSLELHDATGAYWTTIQHGLGDAPGMRLVEAPAGARIFDWQA